MRTTYQCGCSISQEEFGIPAHWPMVSFCPHHGAPKVRHTEKKDVEVAVVRVMAA